MYKILNIFYEDNLDLCKIESRPNNLKNFEYYFYIEFFGNCENEKVKKFFLKLKKLTKKLRVLGSFADLRREVNN